MIVFQKDALTNNRVLTYEVQLIKNSIQHVTVSSGDLEDVDEDLLAVDSTGMLFQIVKDNSVLRYSTF